MAENNKAGGSAPPTAVYYVFNPQSQTAVNNNVMEHQEISNDKIAYACEVMTKKYNIDPRLARSFFFYDSALVRRRGRKTAADMFRSEYTYGSVIDGCNSSNDRKTCILPGDTLSWQDESSGTTWVGVHGMDSICVVTRSRDLDVTRLRGSLVHWLPIHDVLFDFRKSLIVEIEDLADASSKLRQRFHQKIEKPFGVVSVIPDTNKNHKKSSHKAPSTEYGEMKAIEFLQEKLSSDTIFTVNETIQTAISAFQHLFQKKFKPDEIQVSVMDPKYMVTDKVNQSKDATVEELNIGQITEHLDVINKRASPCHEKKSEPRLDDSSGGGLETRGSTIIYEDTE